MPTRKQKVVVGVFHDVELARSAVDDLIKAGFTEEQVGLVARDGTIEPAGGKRKKGTGTAWEEGALAGAATGAGVGALWAVGIMAGVLSPIGPLIVGGPLVAILASAAGGAAVAGIAGALIGLGIPEDDAGYYEEEFKAGRTLVTVKANGRSSEALEILRRHGAYNRELSAEITQTPATEARAPLPAPTPLVAQETGTVEVREEKPRVRKTARKKGEVRVRKEVVTEQQTLTVPVEREEVVIERRPARGRKATRGVQAEEIRIPVSEEEVSVDRDVVVKEEVSVGKRKVKDTKTVTTPVRHEEVTIEQEGQPRVRTRTKVR